MQNTLTNHVTYVQLILTEGSDCWLLLGIQQSNPAIFHDPFLLMMIDSGHMLQWTILTSLCRKASPSATLKQKVKQDEL